MANQPQDQQSEDSDSPVDALQALGYWGALHLQSLGENQPETLAAMSKPEWMKECRGIQREAHAMYQFLLGKGLKKDQATEVVLNDLVLVRSPGSTPME